LPALAVYGLANQTFYNPSSTSHISPTTTEHMALSEHNNISIAQIVLFSPALIIGILLCLRHGFGRASGWLLLVIFSLARLIGASLQLATIADPNNISLYFGALTLQNIGISPLCAMLLAMINRVLSGVQQARGTIINPRVLRLAQLVVLLGLILSAVGGSNSGTDYSNTGVYTVSSLTQAGLGLTIAGYALLVVTTAVVGLHASEVEDGEKRLLLAVALTLPFLFVRILYSAIGIYGHNPAFSQLSGNINILLGMAVIEEIFIVFIIEAVGITLKIRENVVDEESGKGLISGALGLLSERRQNGGHDGRRRQRRRGYEMASVNRNSDTSNPRY
jgi:hypothetical protein